MSSSCACETLLKLTPSTVDSEIGTHLIPYTSAKGIEFDNNSVEGDKQEAEPADEKARAQGDMKAEECTLCVIPRASSHRMS